jgi:hypothetical protein
MIKIIQLLLVTIIIATSCKPQTPIDLKKALANSSFLMVVENDTIPIEFIGNEVVMCNFDHFLSPYWAVFDSIDRQYLNLYQSYRFEKVIGTTYFFSGNEFSFQLIKQDSIRFNSKFLEGVWVDEDFDFESWKTAPPPPLSPGPDGSLKIPRYTFKTDSGLARDRHYERPFTFRLNPILGFIRFRGNTRERAWQIVSLDSSSFVYNRAYVNDSSSVTYQWNCKLKKVNPAKIAHFEKFRSE